MGNKSSIQSVSEVKSNHQLTEVGKGNDWADAAGGSTHNGWGHSGGSTGIKDQGWLDKPAESLHNGWGESITKSIGDYEPPPVEVRSNGWMDEAVEGEYQGWSSEPVKQNFNGWASEPVKDEYNGWGVLDPKQSATVVNQDTHKTEDNIQQSICPNESTPSLASSVPHIREGFLHEEINSSRMKGQARYPYNTTVNHVNDPIEGPQNRVNSQLCTDPNGNNNPSFVPSAPPVPEEFLHEVVNSSPIKLHTRTHEDTMECGSSSCIICWESPVEGACVPCGHMAGCMPCLKEIKSKKGDCPICRVKIDQVIKLYAV